MVTELSNGKGKDLPPGDLPVALYQAQMCYVQPIGAISSVDDLENAVENTE